MADSKTVSISLEFTPNPNTLKYVVDFTLLERGSVNFTNADETAKASPLAKRLFEVVGVCGVMIGRNFVTITKGNQGDWESLNRGVNDILHDHLSKGLEVVDPAFVKTGPTGQGDGEIEEKIRHILDEEIRPAIAQDGGDITFEKYEDGVVYLYLQGSCSGCPSSTATLKQGIETRLKKSIPEIKEVVSV